MNPERQRAWMDLRGAVLTVPIMLRVALRSPDDRADAVGVARVARHLYADAVAELGEVEAEDLVGATLRYVRDRILAVYGETAWEEVVRTVIAVPRRPETPPQAIEARS